MAVPMNLTLVAIWVTVVSDLFTVLQSEVNCHHVFKSASVGGLQTVIFAGH